MSTEIASPTARPVEPERPGVAATLHPWLVHALYVSAILFAAAVLALGLSERNTPAGTVVVPGPATVRIIIEGPPDNPSTPGDPLSPGGAWSGPGSGAVHPSWCTEVCPGIDGSRPADSSRGIS